MKICSGRRSENENGEKMYVSVSSRRCESIHPKSGNCAGDENAKAIIKGQTTRAILGPLGEVRWWRRMRAQAGTEVVVDAT